MGQPQSHEESLRNIRVADDLIVELVAAEPDVVDPVAIRFDEQGRMWVAEMLDYPHGPAEGQQPRSRIRVLEDGNGDGRYENPQTFADNLLFVTGLQPWRGGVIVTLAGKVAYLKDTNGDGEVDLHETWFTGFAEENSQLRANHPQLGLDGYVYVSNGLRGGKIRNHKRPQQPIVPLSGKDFRFNPRTFECEAISGAGQFGLTFDEFGNRFTCTNRNPLIHVVLEERYLRQNTSFAPPAALHDVAAAGAASKLFPISRAWTTSNLHANQFTAACGVLIYLGNALPSSHRGNAFTCDPTGNLVHREILEPLGVTFTATPGKQGEEFMASTDEWFRPVNLTTGPDGGLYVVDMHRAVIEHPQFMPDELKERPDLLLGNDCGRIYRVTSATRVASPKVEFPRDGRVESLVDGVAHPNIWQRSEASRLLLERAETVATVPRAMRALGAAAIDSERPETRVRALWALEYAGLLSPEVLRQAMRDPDARVRAQAIVLSESSAGEFRSAILPLAEDTESQVRFQLALRLAPATTDRDIETLGKLAAQPGLDGWLGDAVAIASAERPADTLRALLSEAPATARQRSRPLQALVSKLTTASTRQGLPEAGRALDHLMSMTTPNELGLRQRALRAVVEVFEQRRVSLEELLLELPETTADGVRATLAAAARIAWDTSQPTAARMESLAVAAADRANIGLLRSLAQKEPTRGIRIQAIELLLRDGSISDSRDLLAGYRQASPAVRRAIAQVTASRYPELLLESLESGSIRMAELDRLIVNRLLKHRDVKLRERFSSLLSSAIPADRQQVLARYQASLLKQGDANSGQRVFRKSCSACHRIGDIGVDVAPDISDSRTKRPEQLLVDILQPNRAVDGRYISYAAITRDGVTLTGVLTNETSSAITLSQPDGKQTVLLRSDLEELTSLGLSLMPDGLESEISIDEMADLLAYIKGWRYLDGRTPLGQPTTGSE